MKNGLKITLSSLLALSVVNTVSCGKREVDKNAKSVENIVALEKSLADKDNKDSKFKCTFVKQETDLKLTKYEKIKINPSKFNCSNIEDLSLDDAKKKLADVEKLMTEYDNYINSKGKSKQQIESINVKKALVAETAEALKQRIAVLEARKAEAPAVDSANKDEAKSQESAQIAKDNIAAINEVVLEDIIVNAQLPKEEESNKDGSQELKLDFSVDKLTAILNNYSDAQAAIENVQDDSQKQELEAKLAEPMSKITPRLDEQVNAKIKSIAESIENDLQQIAQNKQLEIKPEEISIDAIANGNLRLHQFRITQPQEGSEETQVAEATEEQTSSTPAEDKVAQDLQAKLEQSQALLDASIRAKMDAQLDQNNQKFITNLNADLAKLQPSTTGDSDVAVHTEVESAASVEAANNKLDQSINADAQVKDNK